METGLGAQKGPTPTSYIDPDSGKKMVKKGDILFPPRKVWIKTFGLDISNVLK